MTSFISGVICGVAWTVLSCVAGLLLGLFIHGRVAKPYRDTTAENYYDEG